MPWREKYQPGRFRGAVFYTERSDRAGSIPAHAGQPIAAAADDIRIRVYPRACGATVDAVKNSNAVKLAKALAATGAVKGGALVGGAAVAGYGVGTAVDKSLQQFEAGRAFRHELGALIAEALASFGNKNAKDAIATETKARTEVGGTLHIKIDSEGRTRVKELEKSGDMDLDVNTGLIMRGP